MSKCIYVVSSRCGCALDKPVVFSSMKQAEKYVKDSLSDYVITNEDIPDCIDGSDPEKVLEYGSSHGLCDDMNCTGFPDTATVGDEWLEFIITEVEV